MFQWPLLLLSLSHLASAEPKADPNQKMCRKVSYSVSLLRDRSEVANCSDGCKDLFEKLPQVLKTNCSYGDPRLQDANFDSDYSNTPTCDCLITAYFDRMSTTDLPGLSCNVDDVKTSLETHWRSQHRQGIFINVDGISSKETDCADVEDND
ncbi:hypothetical protein BCR37DRAFT_381156 [Protomyces lactucae-debilis]|uniref:Uncharacterized protein n=1 Tax=Protomyces lactucae-debilis TaxID=2754530 RepID=A0A1Y2FAK9_PROLT|nr:uncharacterized protein BCR37DRAFT_381156 [Protomyces lactucae-debilis]ORY80484.1 hypothetical protein BCR37DRAFT_381156 [Protomyces lactucae-debilis]